MMIMGARCYLASWQLAQGWEERTAHVCLCPKRQALVLAVW
jgi:hypothetical protein